MAGKNGLRSGFWRKTSQASDFKRNIEFLLPVKHSRKYIAIAQIPEKIDNKTLLVKSIFTDENNKIYAKAYAEFIIMTGKTAEKMLKDLHLEEI